MTSPPRVAFANGVAAAEATMERKSAVPVVSWPTGYGQGWSNRDNFETNRISLQAYTDSGWDIEAAAVSLTATYACVNFWAGNIAGLSLSVYRKGPAGVAVEDTRHPLHRLLHDSPNYDDSAFDFWEFMVASLEMRGNAYAVLERRPDGFLVALRPIPPMGMGVTRLSTGEIEYRWSEEGGERRVLQGDMLHIRGPLGGPLGGVSPLTVLRNTFSNAMATERAAATVFRNGARPSGVLQSEEKLSVQQLSETERLLQSKFAGWQNAGRPMVLDRGIKWVSLTIDPVDAQMLETRHFGLEEIARAFEVDPHLIGHTHGNTHLGSSISDQTLSLMKFKMRKRLKRIEGALEKQLLTRADKAAGVSIEFNVESFLRADSQGRANYYAIMKEFMTTNEIRAHEGLPPVPGGDVLFKQMQDVPLKQAVENQPAAAGG